MTDFKVIRLMIDSSEIKSRIAKEYNRNPEGWQVQTARDAKGHLDTVFLHLNNVYIIKEDVINPFKTLGVGIHERLDMEIKPVLAPSFGLRPLDYNTLELLLSLDEKEAQRSVISQVLSKRPVPMASIKAPAFIHGPITHSNAPLSIMGSKQKEIDHQLKEELDKLLERKYPHLTTMYG